MTNKKHSQKEYAIKFYRPDSGAKFDEVLALKSAWTNSRILAFCKHFIRVCWSLTIDNILQVKNIIYS